MSNNIAVLLLGISSILSLLNLLVGMWTWHRYDHLSFRVTRLEVRVDGVPTNEQVRQISESIGNMNGRVEVAVQLMTSIQEHLLENEE